MKLKPPTKWIEPNYTFLKFKACRFCEFKTVCTTYRIEEEKIETCSNFKMTIPKMQERIKSHAESIIRLSECDITLSAVIKEHSEHIARYCNELIERV